ncbi:DNA polymerase beta superfamily protein [Desertivirga brevis]|uniref:DNA polymerase beta superfamily protein n=1 Tax=Desertivirga brevis TaxID=2810310 RepID=UPI001A977224|nr:nucleotidyltransferase domain-containing protein [Pedobacter sp. SYSU D00873]
MTFEALYLQNQFILLDCISGSKAYNLALPSSDTDKKGVFILPQGELFGFGKPQQLNNESNDEVYFELRRFLELLLKNNPNILELLSTPEECVIYKHPLMELIRPEHFLSKLCLDTFAGYATSQIKKAKGLNKKINKAFELERKSVLDFCYVVYSNGSVSLKEWLQEQQFRQEECGLSKLQHFKDVYLLYHQSQLKQGETFYGIVAGPGSADVQLATVPKGIEPLAVMNFNKDAYSIYCREFREYWEWVRKRNEARYQSTLFHGKSYDAKNMMHTFRLLNMAEEIALYKEVRVSRDDRDFLLKIRSGEFEYEELIQMVEEKMEKIKVAYEHSQLPLKPDEQYAESLLIQLRESFYRL